MEECAAGVQPWACLKSTVKSRQYLNTCSICHGTNRKNECIYKLCSLEPWDWVSQASVSIKITLWGQRGLVKMQVPWPPLRDSQSVGQYGTGESAFHPTSLLILWLMRDSKLKRSGLAGWQWVPPGWVLVGGEETECLGTIRSSPAQHHPEWCAFLSLLLGFQLKCYLRENYMI